jgi:hypothetical protein
MIDISRVLKPEEEDQQLNSPKGSKNLEIPISDGQSSRNNRAIITPHASHHLASNSRMKPQ